jgi:hypothetical protein
LATVGCETPSLAAISTCALPDLTNQIGNQFNIIINQFTPVRFTDLAKPSTCSSTFTSCVVFLLLAYLRDGSLYFLSGVTLPAPGIESAHCKP